MYILYYTVLLGVKREATDKTVVNSTVCTIVLLAMGVKREANKTLVNSDMSHDLDLYRTICPRKMTTPLYSKKNSSFCVHS
jgi:hypothetical protein